jgi:hypothetical protein
MFCLTAGILGASVTIQKCTADDNQRWDFDGTDGVLKIFGNKCLDVPNGDDKDGTRLQIRTCGNGDTNQQWFWRAGSKGYVGNIS